MKKRGLMKRVASFFGIAFLAGLLIMPFWLLPMIRVARSVVSGPAITISKETTFIDGPLDAEGNVDYVAALNQLSSEGVTPENNAVVLFWQAFGPGENVSDPFFELIGVERPPADGHYLIDTDDYRPKVGMAREADATDEPADAEEDTVLTDELREQLDRATSSAWSADEYPTLAELLKRNQAPLELIVEGTRRPSYYAPLVATDEQRMILEILRPTQHRCREVARFLLARAMLRLGEGKTNEAWQDLLACHRLGRLLAQDPLIIGGMIGVAIEGMAISGQANVAAYGKLSGREAQRFLADLESFGPMPKMVDKIITGERYSGLDSIMGMARMMANEVEDKPFIPSGRLGRSISKAVSGMGIDWDELLRTYNIWFDRLVEVLLKPTRAEQIAGLEQIERELDEACTEGSKFSSIVKSVIAERSLRTVISQRLGTIMSSLPSPLHVSVLDSGDRVKTELNVTRIAFALAAYHAERGEYPENLADLSPDYLAEVPQDLFAEGDFRYLPNQAGYLLYGVGQNGKDDGGRNYWVDYGHLDHEQIPEDAERDTDDIAVRVPLAK